jgi:hypothetical protein
MFTMRSRTIGVIGLMALLAGCANMTGQHLRAEAADVLTFDVAQPYQAVYRTILTQAGACYASGGYVAPTVIDGELSGDTASGQIAVRLYRMGRMVTLLAIDVTARATEQTRVIIYAYSHAQRRDARAIEGWVTTGATGCEAAGESI